MLNKTFTRRILMYPALFALAGLMSCNAEDEMSPDGSVSQSAMSEAAIGSAAPGITLRSNHYILIGSAESLPAGLENELTALGGKVTAMMAEAGVAAVSSDDPDFIAKASKLSGVRSVVRDLEIQWYKPEEMKTISIEEAGINPPSTADNDPWFPLQWGHTAIQAPAAWNTGARGQGVRIAVLDGGFDMKHVDLAPNIDVAASASFVPGEAIQFVPRPGKTFSHGTHVAGTIGAVDNNIGMVGVAPDAKLILVKVLRDSGTGSFSSILQGIVWATMQKADVINMSLGAALPRNGRYLVDNGTPDDTSDDYVINDTKATQELLVAISKVTNYAHQNGVTLIAAAGNDANNGNADGSLMNVPAAAPNVISISSTSPSGWALDRVNSNLDGFASYSNYGTSDVDFAAPGGDVRYPGNELANVIGIVQPAWVFDMVFSLNNGNSATWSIGTSMASPHAAGVAALVISANGGKMSPSHVRAILRASADDLGKPGRDPYYGYGRINALRAVTQR
ncbi:MAG: S8 family serine peptidase [Hymenobacteraceae bacterium]|nr:S8 family serine peptidase [Hymenobacteraceae bacterium]